MKRLIYVVLWLALVAGCWALNAHKQGQRAEVVKTIRVSYDELKQLEGGGFIEALETSRATLKNLDEWRKLKLWVEARRQTQLKSLREGKVEWASF